MNHLIHIKLDRLEGSLMRILGLVERRGFHIDEMELYDLGEATRGLTLKLRLRDQARTLETLGLQIDRLYGIERVENDPRQDAGAVPAPPQAKQEIRA